MEIGSDIIKMCIFYYDLLIKYIVWLNIINKNMV